MQFSQMKVQFKNANIIDGLLEMLGEWLGGAAGGGGGGGAPSLRYDSFAVEYSSRLTLSAADHVYALWAHLTAETAACASLTTTVWCAAPRHPASPAEQTNLVHAPHVWPIFLCMLRRSPLCDTNASHNTQQRG